MLGFTACTPAPDKVKGNIRVVATTGMVADLVRQIGGDQIRVEQLLSSGVDPHLYKPNTDDVRAVTSADIVFYNGFKLEGRMSDLLGKANSASKKYVAIAESIPSSESIGDPEHDAADPHVWMDVTLWAHATHVIESTLVERLPEHALLFRERASELRSKLMKLDEQGRTWMASIPESQRVLITSHDAFRYFGRRYGLQVEGIQGVSTSSEAGLKRISDLVSLLVEKKIPAAFVESSVPEKSIRALLEGAAQRGSNVAIGGELYSDAMGPSGSEAESYEGMMLHNFRTIAKALGGNTDTVKEQPK
jgi:manganese/zinc/iron transport system substrate-binding protein